MGEGHRRCSNPVRSEPPTGASFGAIDRFHLLAMECIRLRLATIDDMGIAAARRTNTLADAKRMSS
jgi:hypothetical protein